MAFNLISDREEKTVRKRFLSAEQQLKRYKRKFRITVSLFMLFVALTAVFIYMNYDYLAFKYFIAQHYCYTDALDQIFREEIREDVNGKYYSYFDNMVISVVTRRIRETNNDRYTYLYIPEQYKRKFEVEKEEAAQSEIKELNDKTIYMRITNFSKYTQKFLADNAKLLDHYPYLIIDLRDNGGGDIDAMSKMSGLFLPKGAVVSRDDMRFIDWTYKAGRGKKLNFEKIIILQNGETASASESFIAALKDNLDNVLLIGTRTFGKGIGQFTLPLRRGYAVKATILEWYTPGGVNIHGKGISPDIEYDRDDIIEFALKQIQ